VIKTRNLRNMNLFFLSFCPREAAQAHCDRHVVKMILETAQLLSTAHRVVDGHRTAGLSKAGRKQTAWTIEGDAERDSLLYRATHVNHPVSTWIRTSTANYDWAYLLFLELLKEYTFRYGKTHACTKLVRVLATPPAIDQREFTSPPTCMPLEFCVQGDVVCSYRNYYREGKAHLLKYKKREPPAWLSPTSTNC